ncbi:hypothetical protein Q7P35_005850 [Cladosporium inversicolor]
MSDTTATTKDVKEMVRKTWCEGPLTQKVNNAPFSLAPRMLCRERVKKEGPQFHTLWHDICTVESATVTGNNVKMTFRFPVLYEYCNPAHLLHGAAQAVFYDVCMAYLPLPLRKPGFWEELGFTRNLNVNFLRTAKLGEFVLLDLEVTQIGKNMCYLQGAMKRERDGALISTCEQNKFNTGGGNMMAKL